MTGATHDQRTSGGEHPDRARATDRDGAASSEDRLPSSTAAYFGSRYGHDFSAVRVHTDERAGADARNLHAHAFTVGSDIHFAPGRYEPHTADGQRLIAHELAHVVQQQGQPATDTTPDRSGERAADNAAQRAIAGGRHRIAPIAVSGPQLQVDPRHAKGHIGEQAMGFVQYPAEEGWIFFEGPSGAGGHGTTASGFDGVAYNTRTTEVHLLDNKALARAGNVSSATAIDPAKNLSVNLDPLIARVRAAKDVPGRIKLLERLQALKRALASGQPLPPGIKLVVTGQYGKSTGVTPGLGARGVEFGQESARTPLSTTKNSTPVVETPLPPPSKTAPLKTPPAEVVPPAVETAGVRQQTARPPSGGWRGGLKAGAKAAGWMLLFMGLDYLVQRRLEQELDKSLREAHSGAMPWALRLKREDPSKPVYIKFTVRSERKQKFIPLLGWMPDPPVLHMTSMEMVRTAMEPRTDDGSRVDFFHAEDWREVVYTDLMVE